MAVRGNTMFKDAVNLLRVLEAIPRDKIVSTQEISRRLMSQGIAISERNVRRYLDTIVENPDLFQIEAIKNTRPYGYKWKINASCVSWPLTSPGESLLLGIEKARLSALRPPQLIKPIKQFLTPRTRPEFEKLSEKNKSASWTGKIAVVPDSYPFMAPRITKTVLERVAEGVLYEKRLLVRALMRDEESGLNVWRDLNVSPLGIVSRGERIYLVCLPKGSDKPIRIAMNRILRAYLWQDDDSRPDFNLSEYADVEMSPAKASRYISLSFTTDDAELVEELKESPFNSSQRIRILSPGLFLVTAELNDSPLLDAWLGLHQAKILRQSKMPAKNPSTASVLKTPALEDLADEAEPLDDVFGIRGSE